MMTPATLHTGLFNDIFIFVKLSLYTFSGIMTPVNRRELAIMDELEKVEKLREKANVTYTEAKEALDNAGGDLLDALIYLEKQGRASVPPGGGFYSGADERGDYRRTSAKDKRNANGGESFSDMMRRFGRFCLDLLKKGLVNYLDASRYGVHVFSCPILVLVVLVLFFFWATIPLYIISLFFGFSYRFRGPDLGRDSINNVMDSATVVVNDVKRSFTDNSEKNNKE